MASSAEGLVSCHWKRKTKQESDEGWLLRLLVFEIHDVEAVEARESRSESTCTFPGSHHADSMLDMLVAHLSDLVALSRSARCCIAAR